MHISQIKDQNLSRLGHTGDGEKCPRGITYLFCSLPKGQTKLEFLHWRENRDCSFVAHSDHVSRGPNLLYTSLQHGKSMQGEAQITPRGPVVNLHKALCRCTDPHQEKLCPRMNKLSQDCLVCTDHSWPHKRAE